MNKQKEALDKAHEVVLKWLCLRNIEVVDIALATVVANRTPGDPLWLLLVGAPSTGKSEILRGLFGCPGVHPLGGFTANTFASGFERIEKASLLENLDNNTTLVVKDFGSLLSMRREDRAIVLQQLREIYDGYYRKEYGNGKVVEWQGCMGLLAASTSSIESYHSVIGELGNRYILYRCDLESEERKEIALRALIDEGYEEQLRGEIHQVFTQVLAVPPPRSIEVPLNVAKKVSLLADLTTRLRSPVTRDPYDKRVSYMPDIEGPPRLAKALVKLLKGLAAIRGNDTALATEYKTVYKTAFDTIPRRRKQILFYLNSCKDVATKVVSQGVGLPLSTTGLELEDMLLIGVVHRDININWSLREGIKEMLQEVTW